MGEPNVTRFPIAGDGVSPRKAWTRPGSIGMMPETDPLRVSITAGPLALSSIRISRTFGHSFLA